MTRRLLTALLPPTVALALLLAACSKKDNPPAAPTEAPPAAEAPAEVTPSVPSAAPSPTPAPTKQPVPPSDARPFTETQLQQVQPYLTKVEEVRGSPPKADVSMNLTGRIAAIQNYRESYDDEDIRLLTLQQDMYRVLGMIPPTSNLVDLFLRALGVGIMGFYDPRLDAFYMLDDLGSVTSRTGQTIIVHEYAHALQDQYYDLDKMGKARRGDFDAELALSHLIEGDATATEAGISGSDPRNASCFEIPRVTNSSTIPYVISRLLDSWYEDGYCFVKAVAPGDPAKAAPQLFANPPVSSEQVLHPEKYRAGEVPVRVALTPIGDAIGEGWQEQGRSTFGEFTLQNMLVLGLRNERPKVQEAAAGWGGDTWVLYTNGTNRLLHAEIAWDTTGDARVFFDSLFESLTARLEGQRLPPTGPASFTLQLDASTWRVAITGDRVTMVVSTDTPALERVAMRLGMP